jgi:hypothetical protein
MTTTAQDIFDKVVAHLREQKVTAYDEERGACQYRMANGLKCAVGCLLLDEEYDPRMDEGLNVGQLFCGWPAIANRLGRSNLPLLNDLQRIHDNWAPSSWEERLEALAKSDGLTYTPPSP